MRRVALAALILLVLAASVVLVGIAGTAPDVAEPPTTVTDEPVGDPGDGQTGDGEPARTRVSPDRPAPEAAAPRHDVIVEVISASGEPVIGVRVELRAQSESTQPPAIVPLDAALTGAGGRARLCGEAGAYEVAVRHVKWATWVRPVDLPTADVLQIDVARGVRILLRVQNPHGEPIAGARAREMFWDAAPPAVGGDDGVIDMGPVAAVGFARFRVFASGYGTTLVGVSRPWERAPSFEVPVTLYPGGPLRVRVRDVDGGAVPGARVWVRASQGDVWAVTNEDGEVLADGVLRPPSATISATAPDGRRAGAKLDIDQVPEDERAVDLVLEPGRVVAGIVVRAAGGGPVADAGIYTFGDPSYRLLTRTDADGRFRIERRPGAADEGVELLVLAPGLSMREEQVGNVELGEAGSAGLRIELVEAVRLVGRVVGPDERPVAGAIVRVQHPEERRVLSEKPLTTTADRDGRFEISGVPVFDALHVLAESAGLGTGWCEELDELAPAARVDVGDIDLPRTFTLAARVTDHSGALLPDAWLVARYRVPASNGGFFPRRVQDGAFLPVPDLPLGRAYVEIDGPGFFKTRVRVNEATEFLVADRKCHVTGQVEAAAGPLAGKWLQLRFTAPVYYTLDGTHAHARTAEDGNDARATIAADGRFECGPVRPGAYEVRVEESQLRGKVFVHADGENLGTVELK